MTVASTRLEEARRQFAQLRCLAGANPDPEVRTHLYRTADQVLAENLPPEPRPTGSPPPQHLTGREIDVLAVIATGTTNIEAAQRLGVSPETVKGYLRTAMHKLQAGSRHNAVLAARRHHLIP